MSGLSSVNNMRNFYVDDAKKKTNVYERTKLIAQLAYGHGFFEGKSGGTGNMAIIGDKLVKFNTKSKERDVTDKLSKDSAEYKEMKDGCDKLRQELRKMAIELKGGMKEEELGGILKELGFGAEDVDAAKEGTIKDGTGLFTRVTAASVVKKLARAAEKADKKLKGFLDKLFDKHTPSWGNSVTAFNVQVAAHKAEVLKKIPKNVRQIIEGSIYNGGTNEQKGIDIMGGIANHFPEDANDIKNWLNKTCTFLFGLVPTNTEEEKSYNSIRTEIEKGKEDIGEILDLIAEGLKNNNLSEKKFESVVETYSNRKRVIGNAKDAERENIEQCLGKLEDYIWEHREALTQKCVPGGKPEELGDLDDGILDIVYGKGDKGKTRPTEDDFSTEMKVAVLNWMQKNLSFILKACQGKNRNEFDAIFEYGGKIKGRDVFGSKGFKVSKNMELATSWQYVLDKRYNKLKEKEGLNEVKKEVEKAKNDENRLESGQFKSNLIPLNEGEEIKNHDTLLRYGFRAIKQTFSKMLSELSKITFSDGSKYPDLSKKDKGFSEAPQSFKDVRDQLGTVVDIFNDVLDQYGKINATVNDRVKDVKELADWKQLIDAPAKEFDKICGGTDDKIVDKAARMEYLKTLAEQGKGADSETLQKIAISLVKMLGATYYSLTGEEDDSSMFDPQIYQHDKEKDFQAINLFTNGTYPGKSEFNPYGEKGLYAEAKKIKNMEDFKSFVDDLVGNKSNLYRTSPDKSIFDHESSSLADLPEEFPIGLSRSGGKFIKERYHRKAEWSDEENVVYDNNAMALRLPMECFTRLHEVATAFGVINERGARVSKLG